MKRIILLAVAALVLVGIAHIWTASHGDIYRTLGLRCELRWDVAEDGSITRYVRFTGPTAVGRYIAAVLEIDERNGWQHPEDAAGRNSGVEFVKTFEPGMNQWQLTRLEDCSVRNGEMHYCETWVKAFDTRAAPDDVASAIDSSSRDITKLREDFNNAIGEMSRRFDGAVDQFTADIPTTLTVRMPGPIRDVEGLVVDSAKDRASLSGQLRDLRGKRLELVSLVGRSTEPSSLALWASLVALVAVVCVIVIATRRRITRLRRLRESLRELVPDIGPQDSN